ncbi:MAG TPA: class I SAM-dependent methyltransferase [Gemmatimonadaceae bacterium]|nr:class I SAM-dependent methyltransferase [Gemmatimonadaceae bacterium]
MESPLDVRASYDSAASAYAEHLFGELEHKPLDRHLLNRFAEAVRGRGRVVDLGCGPGHVAKYLHEQGIDLLGVDLSPEMVSIARRSSPDIEFQVGDMHALDLPAGSVAGIVAFYSIVHFEAIELELIFRECRRVLMQNGWMLVAFHVGDQTVHVEDLYGRSVDLDFHFHLPADVRASLRAADLIVMEGVEREPYDGVEYSSRRSYLLAAAL